MRIPPGFGRKRARSLSFLVGLGLLLSGCGGSGTDFVVTGQSGTPQAPQARPDAYSTGFQTPLAVAANQGVLLNDSPNPLSGQPLEVNFQSTSLNGGLVTLTDDGGGFTYTPPPGFIGVDTFGYELLNGVGVSRTTVTIEVTLASSGVFVDSRVGSDATGDAATGSPFASVQAAVQEAGPGGDIIVLTGQGTYTGQVNLLNGQRLLGTQSSLVNAQGVTRPTLSGPVVLADGNTVDSIRVVGTNGIGIDGDGQNSGTITNCDVGNNLGGTGIQMRGVSGSWLIEDNTVFGVNGIGIDLDTQNTGVAVVKVIGNSISNSLRFGLGIAAFGQSTMTAQVQSNVLTGNGPGLGPNKEAIGVLSGANGAGTLNLQFVGNQNDALYAFLQANGTTVNVQQFSSFSATNTGTVIVVQGTVTDVPAIQLP